MRCAVIQLGCCDNPGFVFRNVVEPGVGRCTAGRLSCCTRIRSPQHVARCILSLVRCEVIMSCHTWYHSVDCKDGLFAWSHIHAVADGPTSRPRLFR